MSFDEYVAWMVMKFEEWDAYAEERDLTWSELFHHTALPC